MRWSSDSWVTGLEELTEVEAYAFERGIDSAQTPEETIEMGKRAPSSLVQFMTPTGKVVWMERSLSVFRASMPA